MAITLYSLPKSSGTRAHWALEELGLSYELHTVDKAAGELASAAYRAIHPHGKVPALVDGDQVVFESVAILIHLGQRHGVERGLWPRDGAGQAAALSWTVWSQTELQPYMMQYAYHGLDTPVSYAPGDRSAATAAYNGKVHEENLSAIEARLDGRAHLMGDDFTLVDLAVASIVAFGKRLGAGLGERPRTTAWLDGCLARPARRKAV